VRACHDKDPRRGYFPTAISASLRLRNALDPEQTMGCVESSIIDSSWATAIQIAAPWGARACAGADYVQPGKRRHQWVGCGVGAGAAGAGSASLPPVFSVELNFSLKIRLRSPTVLPSPRAMSFISFSK